MKTLVILITLVVSSISFAGIGGGSSGGNDCKLERQFKITAREVAQHMQVDPIELFDDAFALDLAKNNPSKFQKALDGKTIGGGYSIWVRVGFQCRHSAEGHDRIAITMPNAFKSKIARSFPTASSDSYRDLYIDFEEQRGPQQVAYRHSDLTVIFDFSNVSKIEAAETGYYSEDVEIILLNTNGNSPLHGLQVKTRRI